MSNEKRKKYGGRQPGTPNKRTQELKDRIEALGCDPVAAMVQIGEEAMHSGDHNLAFSVYKELMQYMYPKRKAIEVQATVEAEPMPIKVIGVSADNLYEAS
jgi:hypothetical protein